MLRPAYSSAWALTLSPSVVAPATGRLRWRIQYLQPAGKAPTPAEAPRNQEPGPHGARSQFYPTHKVNAGRSSGVPARCGPSSPPPSPRGDAGSHYGRGPNAAHHLTVFNHPSACVRNLGCQWQIHERTLALVAVGGAKQNDNVDLNFCRHLFPYVRHGLHPDVHRARWRRSHARIQSVARWAR